MHCQTGVSVALVLRLLPLPDRVDLFHLRLVDAMAGLDWGPTGQPRNGVVLLKAAGSLRKLHRVVADFLAVVLEILGAALVETEFVDDGAVEAIRTAAERFE
jgi:hypothetical protein